MKQNRTVMKTLSLITQLGITMLTSIFMCMFIGLWLDKKFSTHYFFIPFLLLGIAGGFRGVYTLVQNANHEEKETEDEE